MLEDGGLEGNWAMRVKCDGEQENKACGGGKGTNESGTGREGVRGR